MPATVARLVRSYTDQPIPPALAAQLAADLNASPTDTKGPRSSSSPRLT